MSVVMLHVKTVALVSSPCLNGAITPQHTPRTAGERWELNMGHGWYVADPAPVPSR
jgi:hypothetical protein